jgi:O-antigen/teichoic acid export membrane protein
MQSVHADNMTTAAQKRQRIRFLTTGIAAAIIMCCVMVLAKSFDFVGLLGLIGVTSAIFLCLLVGANSDSELTTDARIFIGLGVVVMAVLVPSGLSAFSAPDDSTDPIPMIQYVPSPAAEASVVTVVNHP